MTNHAKQTLGEGLGIVQEENSRAIVDHRGVTTLASVFAIHLEEAEQQRKEREREKERKTMTSESCVCAWGAGSSQKRSCKSVCLASRVHMHVLIAVFFLDLFLCPFHLSFFFLSLARFHHSFLCRFGY